MTDWESDKNPGWGAEPVSAASRNAGGRPESSRDWRLIEKLVMSLQSEQRKSRRWGIFFKLLTFIYLFAILLLLKFPLGRVCSLRWVTIPR